MCGVIKGKYAAGPLVMHAGVAVLLSTDMSRLVLEACGVSVRFDENEKT